MSDPKTRQLEELWGLMLDAKIAEVDAALDAEEADPTAATADAPPEAAAETPAAEAPASAPPAPAAAPPATPVVDEKLRDLLARADAYERDRATEALMARRSWGESMLNGKAKK